MVDQLQDTHDHLSRAVEALVSGADWQRMLSVASRFHTYSTATNSLMIAAQFPTASHIGGYQFWRTLGRQVRAGERGIRILAPVTCRTTTDDTTEPERLGDDERHLRQTYEILSVMSHPNRSWPASVVLVPTLNAAVKHVLCRLVCLRWTLPSMKP